MPQPSPDISPADLDACAALLASGSKSFAAAARLLPGRVRRPAIALYAFCRLADDAIDLSPDPGAALDGVRARLAAAYAGAPAGGPADRAFAATVMRHRIPRALPEALVEGFAWDAEGRRYASFDDLAAYCARVAGTVGVMMALVMGVRERGALARASDLGIAMQLTNIARDVGEDARAGRLYLPVDWLAREGLAPEALLDDPAATPAVRRVVARLLAEAARLYARALPGVGRLPLRCRPAIHAARLIYAEIGEEIARAGFDTVARRAVVPARRKAELLTKAVALALSGSAPVEAPPLAAARFLVEAVPMPAVARRGVSGDALFVLDLWERLERAERSRAGLRQPAG
jgi:phytoene synthase